MSTPEQPNKLPTDGPCSPCGDGDVEMKYHDHGTERLTSDAGQLGGSMKADKKRKPGFYWVRFEGAVIVAEYINRPGFLQEADPHWHVPGSPVCFRDKDVCDLLSGRLRTPMPPRKALGGKQ